MIRVQLYNTLTQTLKSGGDELIEEWKSNPELFIWADFSDHQRESEQQIFTNIFGIHELALQDAQRERHPPKIEVFDGYTFILYKALHSKSRGIEYATIQLGLFVSDRFLLTRHSHDSPSTNMLWQESLDNPALFQRSPAALALRLSRIMVGRYINVILSLENRLDELEDEMLEHPSDEILGELIGYKGNLKKLRRVFIYHEQMFHTLKDEAVPGIPQTFRHEVIDVFEQQERAVSLTGLYYELASDLIDGYISLASHKLNQIMKVLTIITAIFVPLGLVAGIYGMNFEFMPELHTKFGYFGVLGFMTIIALSLLYMFRKKQWV